MMEEDAEVEVAGVEQRAASIRRTFTMRNSAARQAVNFMPSRQLPYNTLRLRRNNSEHNALLEEVSAATDTPDAADKQADIIVREMEQQRRLMEDNPVAEELRREALRDLPQGLTMKRHVRAKLSASVSLRSKTRPISIAKRLKYRISFAWKRARDRLRNLVFSIELWYEAIRNIEGHFGSAVGSYFYFLRWLFTLDLVIATLLVCFVVIPQVLHDQSANGTAVERGFLDFVSGKGWLEESPLFYGHYHHGDIAGPGPLAYNMPFAYFFTMICLYLVTFGVLCYRTAYSYRVNFIETSGGLSHVFASKVFCGWDFGVVSQRAADLNASSIYYEFKELLNEQNKKQTSTPFLTKLGQWAVNLLVTALVVGVIAGAGLGVFTLLRPAAPRHWPLLVSLVVTLVVALCPILFHLVVKLEYYRPRTALYVTLARTWLLDQGTLLLLLVYWAGPATHATDTNNTQQHNTTSQLSYAHNNDSPTTACWETSFGQEAYRLVLLDAVICLLVLPIFEFTRAFIYKYNPGSGAPEFNIAYNSLTLIFNQAVVWAGALFSPLLAAAVALKLLLLFYVKRHCALRACHPARKVWRAAQTQTVLYMFVTLSLFATLFALGSLFLKSSSQVCGPFRSYPYVYSVFSEGVLRLPHRDKLRAVVTFVLRPGVFAFLMLFLCMAVYYMRAKALAQHSMVGLLRHMLVLQAKDKEFLLNAIAKVSNGEWRYSAKLDSEGPDSHTWKYLREVRKPSNSGFQLDASRRGHALADTRPRSYANDRSLSNDGNKPDDGDTDSSFSWQGSNNYLNKSDADGKSKWL